MLCGLHVHGRRHCGRHRLRKAREWIQEGDEFVQRRIDREAKRKLEADDSKKAAVQQWLTVMDQTARDPETLSVPYRYQS